MITRIEIDGFKSLRDFSLDLEPFTVLVGPNSAGKSNVLEALMLLSRLASMPILEAFKGGRGRVLDQFTRGADGPGQTIRFAVEILTLMLPEQLSAELNAQTRLRYELTLERELAPSGVDHISVTSERLLALAPSEDEWVTARPAWSPYARYGRKGVTLFVQPAPSTPTDRIRQIVKRWSDTTSWTVEISRTHTTLGASSSLGQAETITPADLPDVMSRVKVDPAPPDQSAQRVHLEHLLKELNATLKALSTQGAQYVYRTPSALVSDLSAELKGLRAFQLDAVRLREASERVGADDGLALDASNLPTVLAELPPPALGALRADLVSLVPGLSSFDVVPEGESFRIDFEFTGGERLPARVVSDGTLRLLAMLAAMHVVPAPNLLGIEEPENGIYPGRLRALLALLQAMSLRHDRVHGGPPEELPDGSRAWLGPAPRIPQVVLTTHSPVLLAAMHSRPECLRFLNVVRRDGRLATHVRRVAHSVTPAQAREFVSLREIDRLLDSAKAEVAEAGE